MTPRTDIVAIPAELALDDATAFILEQGHSRYPVYEENLDRVVGVVLARDVWRAQREKSAAVISEVMREATFVPDTKTVEQLLRHMQREQTHMAVVIDEFGGTAGLVTIEDVVEEVVGEIEDELDEARQEFVESESGEIEFPGRTPIYELNERYGLAMPDEDYTTVAGFVLGRLGRMARVGDEVDLDRGRLRVLAVKGRRVERLSLQRLGPPDRETEGSE
jgi:CBS domain containing-hemolysin-like protein